MYISIYASMYVCMHCMCIDSTSCKTARFKFQIPLQIRLLFHGKYHIKIDQGTLVLLASRDPYDVVKRMNWEITDLDCTHFNGL